MKTVGLTRRARPEKAPGQVDDSSQNYLQGKTPMMRWNKPEMVEIKMDAEISSYQDDNYDPMKDGPLFVSSEKPAETDVETVVPRA
jgi:hypothetical protein